MTVVGRGQSSAAPDRAVVRVASRATEDTVQAALDVTSAAVERMRDALASRGIAAKDAPSGELAISTNEVWENNTSRLNGYVAEHAVSVVVRDLAALGAVVAAIVDAAGDSLRIHGIDFLVSDDAALAVAAREAAFAQARDIAAQYAAAAGLSLGGVLDVVDEPQGGIGPMPKARMAMLTAEASSAPPLEPGDSTVSASVRVVWELV